MGMSTEEIDTFLREEGVGLLSLADAGDAYAVPISFGWDGTSLYFYLFRFGERSKKYDFLDGTETASFAVYTVEDKYRWRSVVATGPLSAVPEDEAETVDDVMFDNAWFPNLLPLDEPRTELRRVELAAEQVTGQQGHGYEHTVG